MHNSKVAEGTSEGHVVLLYESINPEDTPLYKQLSSRGEVSQRWAGPCDKEPFAIKGTIPSEGKMPAVTWILERGGYRRYSKQGQEDDRIDHYYHLYCRAEGPLAEQSLDRVSAIIRESGMKVRKTSVSKEVDEPPIDDSSIGRERAIKRNVEVLGYKICGDDRKLHFKRKDQLCGPFSTGSGRLEHPGTQHNDCKVYYPLWITYDSRTGEITPPCRGAGDGDYSMVRVRYAAGVTQRADGHTGWIKRGQFIDLDDPGAKFRVALLSATSTGQAIIKAPGTPVDGVRLPATTDIFEPNDVLQGEFSIYAQRIPALTREDVLDIEAGPFGGPSLRTIPAEPDRFGNRHGDWVLLDSIKAFNAESDAISKKHDPREPCKCCNKVKSTPYGECLVAE
jgi:hypothetical protein